MTLADGLLALLVAVLWGLNFAVTKTGLEHFPPLLMVTLRFALVAVLLLPFLLRQRGRLKEIVLYSFTLGFLHFSLMFSGLARVDAAVAAIVIQIQVPFTALLSAVLYKDPPGWRRLLGMALSIAGVAILAGEPRSGSTLWAVGLIIAAAMVWATSNLQMKRLSDIDGFALNGWMALISAPLLLLTSLTLEEGQWDIIASADWGDWGTVIYQAVVVVIVGYGLWYRLLRRHPVNQVMPFTLLVPLFGVLSGILFLGEAMSWQLAVGGAATIAGVAIIVVRRPKLVDQKTRAL